MFVQASSEVADAINDSYLVAVGSADVNAVSDLIAVETSKYMLRCAGS